MKTMPPTFFISDYDGCSRETDRFGPDDIVPVLLGLFGEVGGVMAAAKKYRREGRAFVGYRRAVEEEFGDVLWYFAALCRRLGVDLDSVLISATSQEDYVRAVAASDVPAGAVSQVSAPPIAGVLDDVLLRLGVATADLLTQTRDSPDVERKMAAFADWFLKSLKAADVSFAEVASANVRKVRGRFLDPIVSELPTFDEGFGEDERLPDQFEIVIRGRGGDRSILEMNGVVIGDPLTDSIADSDGYRFHDVFHFAHASILHWSPTFRALIKRKRKSDPRIDENEDGGRAIVVEEGLSAFVFARAKQLDFFAGQNALSFDLLKAVQQFVYGYEVDACPLKLWENAILQGYDVFRRIRSENGGIISGSRLRRRLEFRSLGGFR